MADFLKTNKDASVPLLTSQGDYSRWARDFKITATDRGLLGFYTGEIEILSKPDKNAYLYPDNSGSVTARKKADIFDILDAVDEYNLDLEKYRENEKLAREAKSFLAGHVDPALREVLMSHDSPKDAWDFLEAQYQMQEEEQRALDTSHTGSKSLGTGAGSCARALDLLRAEFEDLKLSKFTSISQYLRAIQQLRLDMEAAGGRPVTDDEVVSKILRSLPEQYDHFVDMHYQLVETPGVDTGGLNGLTASLLSLEARIQQRKSQRGQHLRK